MQSNHWPPGLSYSIDKQQTSNSCWSGIVNRMIGRNEITTVSGPEQDSLLSSLHNQ